MEQPEKISGMFICTSCRDIKCILIQFVESFEKRIIGKKRGLYDIFVEVAFCEWLFHIYDKNQDVKIRKQYKRYDYFRRHINMMRSTTWQKTSQF